MPLLYDLMTGLGFGGTLTPKGPSTQYLETGVLDISSSLIQFLGKYTII